ALPTREGPSFTSRLRGGDQEENPVDQIRFADRRARRVARFFADMMLTLAEGGSRTAESAADLGPLWATMSAYDDGPFDRADTTFVLEGLGAVAAALAAE